MSIRIVAACCIASGILGGCEVDAGGTGLRGSAAADVADEAVSLDITSALRTGQQQSVLRRRKVNASATTSSHEFGTTVDIAYLSFVAPQSLDHPSLAPDAVKQLSGTVRADLITRLDSLGTRYAPHLEGELGAVLQQLQRAALVLALRERSQPVYHITVTRYPP